MPPTSDGIDQNLLEFARQVAAIPRRISEKENAEVAAQDAPAPVTEVPEPTVKGPETSQADRSTDLTEVPGKSGKKLRTSDEIGALIMTRLREFGDVPDQGFVITVYGSNPWNTLLMIRPQAGPRIDRTLWLSRVQDITARLRSEFDIADEQIPS